MADAILLASNRHIGMDSMMTISDVNIHLVICSDSVICACLEKLLH